MRIGIALRAECTTAVAVTTDGAVITRTISGSIDELQRTVASILGSIREQAGEDVPTSIAFDVSGALESRPGRDTTAIRVAPRVPVDAEHVLADAGPVRLVHAAGGHTARGHELVPLDERALVEFAAAAPRGGRYVITGVGSRVNPAHEVRVGEILLEEADPASIEYSHSFANSSFAVRERTAVANSALVPRSATTGTALALAVGSMVPEARLYVTTNDGGSAPLARLSRMPVHSVLSGAPTELIGAAALCDLDSGRIIVADGDQAFFGEILSRVPTVVPRRLDRAGSALATQYAHVLPVSASQVDVAADRPLLVTHNGTADDPLGPGFPAHLRTEIDLRALGAACAPLSEWDNRMVAVDTADDMDHALVAAQARVHARLVAAGAAPSQISILEARTVATAYERSRMISVRVRGVAGARTGALYEEPRCT